MRAICCGDRNWKDKELIKATLIEYKVSEVVEGECRGADTLSRLAAKELGIKVIPEPAKWNQYGHGAGPIRNLKMLTYQPDIVLAFHDEIWNSKGTKDMISKAESKGVKVVLISHTETEEPKSI